MAKIREHLTTTNILIFALFFLLPVIFPLVQIFKGNIAFWFDPARDLLLALSNLSKPTLIGQSTGIPGLFYGPFWIWLLSVPLLISKDPRFVTLIVQFIPYALIFPAVLILLGRYFGKVTAIAIWLLFIINFNKYLVGLWNPHIAPLLLLLLTFFVLEIKFPLEKSRKIIYPFAAGITAASFFSFHISLGLAVLSSTTVYFGVYFGLLFLRKRNIENFKSYLITLLLFGIGAFIVFIPFLLFESRHGMNQIKVIELILKNPYPIVGIVALSKEQITADFISTFGNLFQVKNSLVPGLISIFSIVFLVSIFLKKPFLAEKDFRYISFLSLLLIAIIFLYFNSKNPVWDYHFVGIEVIFILILGFFLKYSKQLRIIFLIWGILLFFPYITNSFIYLKQSQNNLPSFATKQRIVHIVNKDDLGQNSQIFAYNPALYAYDYDYLFRWEGEKSVYINSGDLKESTRIVYLIIPQISQNLENRYIDFFTSDKKFKTTMTWHIADGTSIIKRERI